MNKGHTLKLGLTAAAASLIMGATVFPAQAAESKVVHVELTNRSDSGEDGNNWARDNMKRQFRITEVSPGEYLVIIADVGKFTSIAGQQTPGNDDGAAVFGSSVTGNINGGWSASLTAPADFATFDKSALPETINGDGISTGAMVGSLFTGESAVSLGDDWSWNYSYKGQKWLNSVTGNEGNISG
jgi:hypothetical protein